MPEEGKRPTLQVALRNNASGRRDLALMQRLAKKEGKSDSAWARDVLLGVSRSTDKHEILDPLADVACVDAGGAPAPMTVDLRRVDAVQPMPPGYVRAIIGGQPFVLATDPAEFVARWRQVVSG